LGADSLAQFALGETPDKRVAMGVVPFACNRFLPSHICMGMNVANREMSWIFPVVMILANIGAAVVCGFRGEFRRMIYFLASAVCVFAVAVQGS
jgi:hypothetical protein